MPGTNHSLKKIGYLIRFYRRKLNQSQIHFAEEIGISFRNLQRLEMGEVEPKLLTLNRIATYMKIPVSALIRPTSGESLFIKEFSTKMEQESFTDTSQKSCLQNEDLKVAQKLILSDQLEEKDKSALHASLDGSRVMLSPELACLTGVTEKFNEIDDYIAFGSSMERWEYVFRARFKKAVIQNFYYFPKGFKVFEESHYNLNPNPDSPTSECYIKDITARHELETWLRLVHANRLGY
jgi:transcriptional regulator with XRE-family HTH domain